MNVLLTNDDGYSAPGMAAAWNALSGLADRLTVVAPLTEQSACSHAVSLYRPISIRTIEHAQFGKVFAVDGTPADCVRLACAKLVDHPIDLVVSGVNLGANTGVDTYYSGTIAGAREAAMLGIPAIAVSQAVREGVETDWAAVSQVTTALVKRLRGEALPGPGLWSVNFPAPMPRDPLDHVHRVPVAVEPVPLGFEDGPLVDGAMTYAYSSAYWTRPASAPTDYGVVRDGGIAVTPIPTFGRFDRTPEGE